MEDYYVSMSKQSKRLRAPRHIKTVMSYAELLYEALRHLGIWRVECLNQRGQEVSQT
jgi:hypothetical protein